MEETPKRNAGKKAESRSEAKKENGRQKPYFSGRIWIRLITEFIGTYFVTFIIMAGTCWITLTSLSPVYLGVVAFCAYAAMGAVFQGISGAHFNPAVSFAMALGAKISWLDAVCYAISQVLAAITASATMLGLLKCMPSDLNVTGKQWWEILANTFDSSSSDRIKVGLGFAIVLEIIATLIAMALAVKAVGNDGKPERGYFLLSALGYGTAMILISFFTGGGLNPARSTGAAIMASANGVPGVWEELWLFWIIPLLAGAICALVNLIFSNSPQKSKGEKDVGAMEVKN